MVDLGVPSKGQGFYALTIEKSWGMIYGLTYPDGEFFSYQIRRIIPLFGRGSLMSLCALILALFICPLAAHSQDAATIFYHGKIVTVDPRFRIVDSMAVRGDRIVGVGTRREVRR